jgi:pimeloyl-ACP methyl ester carboxylesterase
MTTSASVVSTSSSCTDTVHAARLTVALAALLVACTSRHASSAARRDAGIDGAIVPTAVRDVAPPERDANDASPSAPLSDATPVAVTTRTIRTPSDRSAYVVTPDTPEGPRRLITMIHGVCTPPSYVCGAFRHAAASFGVLVCPVGNALCGPEETSAPTWEESFAEIDSDVETAITAVRENGHVGFTREGAVLAGYSRGGYAAVILAVRHPGRWPYLVITEADVDLTVAMLEGARVRAVALIAGEWGDQIGGERKTVETLIHEGYPARLFVMPKTGHPYSADIDAIMQGALDFVLHPSVATAEPPSGPTPDASSDGRVSH